MPFRFGLPGSLVLLAALVACPGLASADDPKAKPVLEVASGPAPAPAQPVPSLDLGGGRALIGLGVGADALRASSAGQSAWSAGGGIWLLGEMFLTANGRSARLTEWLEGGPLNNGGVSSVGLGMFMGLDLLDRGNHGLSLRPGLRAHAWTWYGSTEKDAPETAYQSLVELPALEAVYSYNGGSWALEAGPRAGLPLVGRFNQGDGRRKLGLTPEVGGHVALATGDLLTVVEWWRFSPISRPIDVVEGKLCWAPRPDHKEGLTLMMCAAGRWGQGQVDSAAGAREATAMQARLMVGGAFDLPMRK